METVAVAVVVVVVGGDIGTDGCAWIWWGARCGAETMSLCNFRFISGLLSFSDAQRLLPMHVLRVFRLAFYMI